MKITDHTDTICAISTPPGVGAISIIRVSGKKSFDICEKIFQSKRKKKLKDLPSHTCHLGIIKDCTENNSQIIDEVLVHSFKAPNSYTGEDLVEISCHGSQYIQQQILQLLIRKGARLSKPGEFTLRAFLNGKYDLSQAEAIADLIASQSSASHKVAFQQMKGEFSNEIKELRKKLLEFTSLIELELDFSDEDVEFADRKELKKLLDTIIQVITKLIKSFEVGNVIKNGVPIAIIGDPNVGKSTLLNTLLHEERAIVSDIPGTTRDSIEDNFVINGIIFHFIDTAGLRDTADKIETLGIQRTYEKIKQAYIILYLFDITETTIEDAYQKLCKIKSKFTDKLKHFFIVFNKIDKVKPQKYKMQDAGYRLLESRFYRDGNPDFIGMTGQDTKLTIYKSEKVIYISAKYKQNIDLLLNELVKIFNIEYLNGLPIVTNVRHYEALLKANDSLIQIVDGLNKNIPTDLLTINIRSALQHLGEITGEITTDEILQNIFSKFCIGK